MEGFGKSPCEPSSPKVVTEVIWSVVTDDADTLRFTAGEHAQSVKSYRKELDDVTSIGKNEV